MQIEIKVVANVPDGISFDDVEEWALWEIGAGCSMAGDNPLAQQSLSILSAEVEQL